MSHVANVEVDIHDLDSLAQACNTLGLQFKRGQKSYAWYGKWMDDWHTTDAAVENGYDAKTFGKGEHAIKVPNSSYEIGVVKNPKGHGFRLLYDNYGRQGKAISDRLGGMKLTKLKAEYGAACSVKHLRRGGYRVTRRVLANGNIKISGVK